MNLVLRPAGEDDIPLILSAGLADSSFQVSERIPFYIESELREWVSKPADNLLYVLLKDEHFGGFFYCKIMSHHWAMLDNFYVVHPLRGSRAFKCLLDGLVNVLRARGISYLTTLIDVNREELTGIAEHAGFAAARNYVWFERFL